MHPTNQRPTSKQKAHFKVPLRQVMSPSKAFSRGTSGAHANPQKGTVQEMSKEPRSYMIQCKGAIYRRNRRHIISGAEPPPQPHIENSDPQVTGPSLTNSVPPHHKCQSHTPCVNSPLALFGLCPHPTHPLRTELPITRHVQDAPADQTPKICSEFMF